MNRPQQCLFASALIAYAAGLVYYDFNVDAWRRQATAKAEAEHILSIDIMSDADYLQQCKTDAFFTEADVPKALETHHQRRAVAEAYLAKQKS